MAGDAKRDRSPLLSRWLSTAPRDETPAKRPERVDAPAALAQTAPERSGETERSGEELLAALRARLVSALVADEARVIDELLAPIVAASLPSSSWDPDELVACFEQVEDVLSAYLLRASERAARPAEAG